MSQQINLFNPAFEPQRQLFGANGLAAALGVLALGMAVMAGLAYVRVAGLRSDAKAGAQRLERAQARLAQAGLELVPRKPDQSLEARLAQAEVRLTAMTKVAAIVDRGSLGNTQGYAEYLRALARQGGQGLWLTGVTIARGGNDLGVQGRALDAALVPGYIARLGSERVMRGKSIGNLVIRTAEPVKGPAVADAALPPFVEFQFQSTPVAAPAGPDMLESKR
jgi:hypothetical protein